MGGEADDGHSLHAGAPQRLARSGAAKLGVIEQANMPGTVEEQPNWRRKLPLTLEEMERDQRFLSTTETLARVLTAPPDDSVLPRSTPPEVRARRIAFSSTQTSGSPMRRRWCPISRGSA